MTLPFVPKFIRYAIADTAEIFAMNVDRFCMTWLSLRGEFDELYGDHDA